MPKQPTESSPRHLRKRYDGPIYDVCRPNNPNIPFFRTKYEYEQIILPPPASSSAPDRKRAWLVEPGVHAIEIYEAIISRTLGHCPPLQKYICRSGVVQQGWTKQPPRVIPGARDQGLREERDVCFTLLSMPEHLQVDKWMAERGVYTLWKPKIATPYGFTSSDCVRPDQAIRQRICGELGFGVKDSDFPRSALPPGVIAQESVRYFDWALPSEDGVARDGRATDDGEFQRIEWPTLRAV